jgi:hypothetical protein
MMQKQSHAPGGDQARAFIVQHNHVRRGDLALRHLERRGDRSFGEQAFTFTNIMDVDKYSSIAVLPADTIRTRRSPPGILAPPDLMWILLPYMFAQ